MDNTAVFRFEGRWKEELVVTGSAGKFILVLAGNVVYLPPESVWPSLAPTWAADLWARLNVELENWVSARGATLQIDPTATVSAFYETFVEKSVRSWTWRPIWALLALGLLACAAWLLKV